MPHSGDRPSVLRCFSPSFWTPLDQVESKGDVIMSPAPHWVLGEDRGRKVLLRCVLSEGEMSLVQHASKWRYLWGVCEGGSAEMAQEQGPTGLGDL